MAVNTAKSKRKAFRATLLTAISSRASTRGLSRRVGQWLDESVPSSATVGEQRPWPQGPRPYVDDDSKNASSMLNAHDLRFYTATLRFIVDDSRVSSCGTLRLPSVWIPLLTGGTSECAALWHRGVADDALRCRCVETQIVGVLH
jgi:hypothetical protein